VIIPASGEPIRLAEAERDSFEVAWIARSAEAGQAPEVLRDGALTVVPLSLAIRRPGTGGRRPEPVGASGALAGRGWTLVPAEPPATCEWTPCYPPGSRDLGFLECGFGATLRHPNHGAVQVPAGAWLVTIAGEGDGGE
jgi:hypothetical protein